MALPCNVKTSPSVEVAFVELDVTGSSVKVAGSSVVTIGVATVMM